MPAELVSLPHRWRPLGVRVAGMVCGLSLFALCIGAWIALGEDIRSKFTVFEEVTLVALGCLGAAVWYALIRARVDAREGGLAVVNGYRRRDLEWAQVVGVRLRRGAPWAEMDLDDGTTIPVMAIQGSDGDRARRAVLEVRALVDARTRTDTDD